MSADEKGQTETPERTEEDKKDTPELSEEGKEKVERMQAAYDDDRETVALPGTDNTITGVAINEWLDDDGNPKFGKDEQQKKDQEHKDEKKDDEQKDAN
ncbi:MAG TPA: hypothetical protein VN856_14220 [Mycobacterium sp.]|uniref:hypothetical protein n=1 Tax=Mycobacterium sp. TaxID=1785 RepID=UPI002CABC27C|nr:hypothetical protein [Mycobacterium sp.]HXO81035.1 hypothetical protein [Mycobacterium sp.]